ncbi:MAG: T9SS type A sorting domain-containing protein [Ferruginibacter sp.]
MKTFLSPLIILFSLIPFLIHAQTVSLKAGFGTNGFNVTNVETTGAVTSDQEVRSLVIQTDGKILMGGVSAGRGIIMRFNDDGTTDASFGIGGKTTVYAGRVGKVLLQSDGKIIVGIDLYVNNFTFLRYNTDGTIDGSFGNGGIVTIAAGPRGSYLRDLILQPDGKIVGVGSATDIHPTLGYTINDVAVTRILSDGSLDPTFDGDGKKIISVSPDSETGLVVGLDFSDPVYTTGKIVIGGTTSPPGALKVVTIRLLPDGTPDTGYDTDGILIDNFSGNSTFNDIKVMSDGRIITAGGTYSNTTFSFELTLIRYNVNGTRDNTFSGDGLVLKPSNDVNTTSPAIALQLLPGDKIIVVSDRVGGSPGNSFVLTRYNTDGSLDLSFDTDGLVTSNFLASNFDNIYDLAVDNAGKYLVGGLSMTNMSIDNFAMRRFNSTGTPDNTFDTDGLLTFNLPSSADVNKGIARQVDGKLVVAGSSFKNISGSNVTNRNFTVARYDVNGVLDPAFGTGGIVLTDIGTGTSDEATSVVIQTDGKIVVAGYGGVGIALARYNTNGTLDATFDGDGKLSRSSLNSYSLGNITNIGLTSTGQIIVACGAFSGGQDYAALIRFNSDGSIDNTFGGSGLALYGSSNNTDASYGMAIQSDGKIVLCGTYNGQGGLLRFTAAGILDAAGFNGGRVQISISGTAPVFSTIAFDALGNIFTGGNVYTSTGSILAIAKVNSAGIPDMTFGTSGSASTNLIPSNEETITFLQVQADGKIIAAGNLRQDGPDRNPFVVRYTATGAQDATFNNNTGIFTKDLYPGSLDYINQYIQGGTVLYGAGYIQTDKQSDLLILAIELVTVAVPVNFIDFTARKNSTDAQLLWTVSGEQNVKHYLVERSKDGVSFNSINTVNSLGNLSGNRTYSFKDENTLEGLNYYRIRSVDIDGKTKLTQIKQLNFDGISRIDIYPNPAQDFIKVITQGNLVNKRNLSVLNSSGQKVLVMKNITGEVVTINIQQLPPGMYWLINGKEEKQSFIKN